MEITEQQLFDLKLRWMLLGIIIGAGGVTLGAFMI